MPKDNATTNYRAAVFRAIPEFNFVRFEFAGSNLMQVWPNCLVLPMDIYIDILKTGNSIWYGSNNARQIMRSVSSIINICADADEYPVALDWLQMTGDKRTPIFNHPSAILKTRRDIVAELLDGTENLIVPNCVRFTASSPQSFIENFEHGEFSYPVLVRLVGTQTGKTLIKVDGSDDWQKIYTIPWPGRDVYMTQYVDFKNERGDYAKIRVTVIGKDHLLRHIKFSRNWAVHNEPSTDQQTAREIALIDELDQSKTLKALIAEFKKIVPLDFWGIDLGFFGKDEPLVFFESNAAMKMVGASSVAEPEPKNGINDPVYRKAMIHREVRKKLTGHIYSPQDWLGTDIKRFKHLIS